MHFEFQSIHNLVADETSRDMNTVVHLRSDDDRRAEERIIREMQRRFSIIPAQTILFFPTGSAKEGDLGLLLVKVLNPSAPMLCSGSDEAQQQDEPDPVSTGNDRTGTARGNRSSRTNPPRRTEAAEAAAGTRLRDPRKAARS